MAASLSVLQPIQITDAILFSTDVPEADYTAWSGATTYAVGDRAISTTTHRIYESLRATNLNHDPTDILNRTGVTPWWFDVGPTNRWAVFDQEISSQTTQADTMTFVLRPGFFNSAFIAGLDADNLEITVLDAPAGNQIYYNVISLENSNPPDYYEYFFSALRAQKDFLVSGLDQYNAAEITIRIYRASGDVKCGVIALGDLLPLGQTQYGAKATPKTYSYIKIDEFGNNVIQRRKASKDMSVTAFIALEEANTVLDIITDLLDVPCVWVGTDLPEYSGLRVFGLGSGEISYDHPEDCMLSLTIQGLI